MLEKIAWNSGTYTTANYDVASSGTYIATSGTTLTWANIYSAPAWWTFKWWNAAAPSTTNVTVSSTAPVLRTNNSNYSAWFGRNMIALTLTKWNGVARVVWAWNYKYNSWVTISATCITASGYVWSGWTKTSGNAPASTTANPTTVTLTQATTIKADCKDTWKPTVTLTSTSTLKSASQTATLKCTDGVGVTAYYWWTTKPTAATSMTTTTAADLNNLKSSAWLSKTISAAWTYYLWCRDAAWNWDYKSIVIHSYKVYNMEENVWWTTTAYNTNNYTQKSAPTYIAPSGTSITLASVYDNPSSSCDTFVWVSTSAPSTTTATVSTTAPTLNANANYGMWFKRNQYALILTAWTWTQSPTWSWTYKWWASVAINTTVKDGYTWSTWTKTAWANPTTFTAWTKSQNIVMACSGTTLRSDATINSYTLTINPNGWVYNWTTSNTTVTQNYGTTYTMLYPTKTWYTFINWQSNAAANWTPTTVAVYNNSKNGTVTHSWVEESTSPTNSNVLKIVTNGTASPWAGWFVQSVTAQANHVYYLVYKAKIPTWYTLYKQNNAVGNNAIWQYLTSQAGTSDWATYVIKLTAWSAGTFRDFGHVNISGSNNTSVTRYVASAQIYDVTSKTIKADFQNKYNFTTATNQTLTAQWTPNTYYIAYNTNGWAWTAMSNTTCTYDSNCALSSNTYTRAWYTFKWWSTSSSATTATYTNGQNVSNLTGINGNTVTLYAVWSDEAKPEWTITGANVLKATSQRLTWTCTDTAWVTAYYLGTSSNPSSYTTITSATSYMTWMNVTAAWTYYLFCKDAAGNISTWKSITYSTYTVQNMLDTIAWAQWTYNTTNYATSGTRLPSASTTYITLSWTTIALNSGTLYWDPIQWYDLYAWWTTANSWTPTYTNPTISTSSVNYYRWFNRTYYDLDLKPWTGISSVNVTSQLPAWYTRVEYIGWTPAKARFNTNVAWWSNDLVFEAKIKYTTYAKYAYFWWNYVNETTDTTRLILGSSAWSVLWTLNQKAGWGNVSSSSFSANTRHTIKLYKENGTSKLNLNGTITTAPVSQWTANNWTIGFNANKSASPSSAASVNQFEYLRIYDKWILIRNYVPCKNSNGVYWMYDLVNETWNPSVWSAQFTWWPEVTWRWVYKYGATPTITATPNTASGYIFSWWTVNAWNTPASLTNASTTVTLTQNTTLTANAKDNSKPVCTWWEPSKKYIKAWESWTITLTCTDAVWIANTSLAWSDITMTTAWLVTLSAATVGWTSTEKTFTFTYTTVANKNGTVTFTLPASKVKDTSNNYADSTWSTSVVVVDTVAPTMSFVSPTPSDNAWQNRNYFTGQLDITEANLSGFTWTFSGNQTRLYDDSLILMYNFDNVSALWETNTLVKDLSKYDNDLTLNWATYTSAGKRWWAYSFDGNDDYGTLDSPEIKSVFGTWTTFTVSAWAKPTSWIDYSMVVWQTNGNYYWHTTFWIRVASNWFHCILWRHTNSNTAANLTNLTYKPDAWVWHHVVCVVNWNTMTMYVDGVNRTSASLSSMGARSTITNPIYVWRQPSYKTFPWQIDEIRVYNRALSTNEIGELYRWNLSKTSTNTWTYTTAYTWLADGTYVYGWTAVDMVWQSATISRTINIDTTKPICTIAQNPVATTQTNGNVTLTATVTEINKDKYSWTWWSNMVTSLTTFTTWTNWTRTFYMQDKAWNTWSCSITVNNIDKTAPSVTLTSNAVACQKWWTTYTITWTYSEAVNGVATWDLTLTNASVVSFKKVSDTVYVRTVKANTNSYGTAKASVWANTATDGAGNNNTVSNEVTWTYDNAWPTFTLSNQTVNECTAWSLSITSVAQVWCAGAHASPYSFDNSTWGTTTTWQFSTSTSQPWSGKKTAYVRDALGNVTSHEATWTVSNVAPTANNFTLNSNVGKSAKTWDWKTLSSAAEWNCGNGSLTASVKTNGSKWSCAINGNVITYTPNSSKTWTDSCVITIKDNENSTKEVTVSVSGIDTAWPSVTLTSNAVACQKWWTTYTITWTYSEAVNGVATWDLTLTNASVVSFKKVSDTVYVRTVKANTNSYGTAKASVWANTATDGAGNNNTVSNEVTWTYDNAWPTFSVNNPSVAECSTWTANIASVEQLWCAAAHASAYSWDGESSYWSSISHSLYSEKVWSQIVSIRVRDILWNYTESTSTFTWTNTAPTLWTSVLIYGNVVSGTVVLFSDLISSMWVVDGACGAGNITKTGDITCTEWSAIWSNNWISVTPPSGGEWSATCTVTFVDDEWSIVEWTVKYTYDTTAPVINPEHGAATSGYVNSWNIVQIPLDVVESKWINTSDFDANDVHIYVNWVEKLSTKTLIYDSMVWWAYKYILTLTNLTWDGGLKIVVPAWSFTDNAWNSNIQLEWISNVVVDNTLPTCSISQNPITSTSGIVTLTVDYDVELNEILWWYSWNWSEFSAIKTNTVSDNGNYIAYVKDAANNVWRCSITVSNIDKWKPELVLDTTSMQKSKTQRFTWICTDLVWITQYYIWNSLTPNYKTISSTTSFTTWIDITSEWTYYMYCRDDAWNVVSGSKTYDNYTVHNMLEKVAWMNWSYNTINYAEISSDAYIAPRQTVLTLSEIYTIPQYASQSTYKWYSTSNSTASPNTSLTVTMNGTTTYYTWFDRERYTLDLIINTWINVIKYKVNGASSDASTQITREDVMLKAWSTIYAYAEAKSGYTHTQTSLDKPWSVLVTWNNVFSPEATVNTNTPYTVYHYVKRVWESTYELADTETKQWTTDETLILSWLAKENGFVCATYDRWSLTWTEDWPWEVVTQTTLKWDGSLKIYLYYNRNSRRVILSGDEHVQYLQIDGEEVTEAVWECGGEVPVNAVPKPWYHFVRWDRERERTQEDDDEETTWW